VTAEVLRAVAILAQPVLTRAAGKLLDLLGIEADARTLAHVGQGNRIATDSVLPAPSPIFPRYVEPEQDAASS